MSKFIVKALNFDEVSGKSKRCKLMSLALVSALPYECMADKLSTRENKQDKERQGHQIKLSKQRH